MAAIQKPSYGFLTGDSQFDENLRRLFFLIVGVLIGFMLTTILYRPKNVEQLNESAKFLVVCNLREPCPAMDSRSIKQVEDSESQ